MTKNVFKRIHIVTISRVICVDPSFHLASFSFHMKNSFHVSCDTVVFFNFQNLEKFQPLCLQLLFPAVIPFDSPSFLLSSETPVIHMLMVWCCHWVRCSDQFPGLFLCVLLCEQFYYYLLMLIDIFFCHASSGINPNKFIQYIIFLNLWRYSTSPHSVHVFLKNP